MANKKVSESVPSLKSRGMKAPRPAAGMQASDEEVRADELKSRGAKDSQGDMEGKPSADMAKMAPSSKGNKKAAKNESWCSEPQSHEEPRMKQDRH